MIVKAKVGNDGCVKIDDASLYGKEIEIHIIDDMDLDVSGSFNWDKLKEILEDIQSKDFPRRSTDEIMNDIDAMRERN